MRLKEGTVEWREIEGEIVALDLDRSEYVGINKTGAALWDLLVAGTDVSSLTERLTSRFGIDERTADRDVESFIAVLNERGLLEDV